MDAPSYVLDFEKPLRDLEIQLESLRQQSLESGKDFSDAVASIEKTIAQTRHEIYSNLTPWQRVQIARHPRRPYAMDYVQELCEDFQELHGDRLFRDDRALIGGLAMFGKQPVMIIAQQKGRDSKERISRNFGMPQPEGYRKALRLMRMAEKFGLPVLSFIDTPGAYPGIGSEERHVSEAIALNIREMAMLRVPSIAVVVGEGGSGGALGIGLTDRVLIFENSYYSVISPENCAVILWRNGKEAQKAAAALMLGLNDTLKKFGVVDEVIPEPVGGAHCNFKKTAAALGAAITKHLHALSKLTPEALLDERYERYRNLGVFEETAAVS